MIISAIAAINKNLAIGNEGNLPWIHKEDMARFKNITMGHPVIMGRKTYESMNPLLGRFNIVLSRTLTEASESCVLARSPEECIVKAQYSGFGEDECFVIGGGEVYRQFRHYIKKLYLSVIDNESDGDTYFPSALPGRWVVTNAERVEGAVFIDMEKRDPVGAMILPKLLNLMEDDI